MKTKVLVAAAVMALGASSAMANLAVNGTATIALNGSNHIVIEAKRISLYEVLLGDAFGNNAATSPSNIFSFAAGAADNYIQAGSGATFVDGDLITVGDGIVDPIFLTTAKDITNMAATGVFQNTLRTTQPGFGQATVGANGITSGSTTLSTSNLVDTQIIVNTANLVASGQHLWLKYQVLGADPVFQEVVVPEPTSIAGLSLGAMALLRRRNSARA